MRVERGASNNTCEAYKTDIQAFGHFLQSKGIPLSKAGPEDIRTYVKSLHDRHLEARTIARHLSALRQFFSFLKEQNIVSHNSAQDLELPKIGRPLPKLLTEREVGDLLEAARSLKATLQEGQEEARRLLCLLELLYATGLRVSELISLPFINVAAALRTGQVPAPLIVKGKGSKERLVLISEVALKALQEYLSVRAFFDSQGNSPWLFPSSSAQGYLTRQRFGQLLKGLAVAAGIDPKRLSPHVIRHAFASHMLDRGADLLSLQKLLGHSDIATTEIYTHLMNNRLEKTVFAHHPLSKIEKNPKE